MRAWVAIVAVVLSLLAAAPGQAQSSEDKINYLAVPTRITIGGTTFSTTSSVKLSGLATKTAETDCLWIAADGSGALGACGTVTSVSATVPSFLSISGSPITSTGTLAVSLVNQSANTIFARSTGTGVPSFQAMTKAMTPTTTVHTDQTNTWGAFLQTFGGGLTVSSGTTTTQALAATTGSFSSTLGVTGISTLAGLLNANAGIAVDTSNFTVNGTTGAVATASTLAVASHATLDGNTGTTDFASQTTGWRITEPGYADVRSIVTNEFRAQRFVADLEEAHNGVGLWGKAVTTLATAFTCPAAAGTATLTVKDLPSALNTRAFSEGSAGTTDNDWVAIRTFARTDGDGDGNLDLTIGDCVGQVSGYVDNGGSPDAGTQSWTFTRGSGGNAGGMTASTVIPADTAVIDFGSVGSSGTGTPGYAEVNAVDGAEGVNAPYFQVVTWGTAPVAANRSVRSRFGKLTGITGTADEFGLLAGTYAATNGSYFRASNAAVEMHGVDQKFFSGSSAVLRLNPNAGDPYIALGSTLPTGIDTNAGIWLAEVAGVAQARIGDPVGNRVRWDGTHLKIVSQYLTIDENGVVITPTTSFTNTRAYTFKGTGGGADFGIQGSEGANTQYINIEAVPTVGLYHGAIRLRATNASTGSGSEIFLEAQGGGGGTGKLYLTGESAVALLTDLGAATAALDATGFVVNGALTIDTSSLVVDATNNRVGVNDATPSYALDVSGEINATSTGYLRGGALVTGAFSLGAAASAGTMSFSHPTWTQFIGDGTGYTWALAKRYGSTTTNVLTVNDSTNLVTAIGAVAAASFTANGSAGITASINPAACSNLVITGGLITAKTGC